MIKSLFLPILLVSLLTVFSPGLVLAADCTASPAPCPPGSVCLPNPLQYNTFDCLIESIMSFIFIISLALAPLMVIIGAFYLMTAGGDPARVKTAQTIFIYTGAGLLIIMLAKGLVAVIRAAVGVV